MRPKSQAELVDVVRSGEQVIAVGNRTKPALSTCSGATMCSLCELSGVIEYEPSEFTITVRAGTRVWDLVELLASKNQYLPFDPMLARDGATVGGTVASGLSGPGRFRFGGVRDFIIGVTLVLGDGSVTHSGGKVVKNAAGFDVPKWMVGSMGRLGILSAVTFKVFPKPASTMTLMVHCDGTEQRAKRGAFAASSRWELDAIDTRSRSDAIYLRLAGPAEVNQAIASEIYRLWGDDVGTMDRDEPFWQEINDLAFAPDRSHVVKVPTTAWGEWSDPHHTSCAGNVTWIATNDADGLSDQLGGLGLSGLVVRGPRESPWVGKRSQSQVAAKLKTAMDPDNRFPP